MLHKHNSAIAKDATFVRLPVVDKAKEEKTPGRLSREERELARLHGENAELRTRSAALEADWAAALSAARQEARNEAARAHVRDDQKFATLLAASLERANADFCDHMLAGIAPAASRLADSAFSRLVTLREADHDWLARLIAQRLKDVMADSVVAVRIGPLAFGDIQSTGEAEAAIRTLLPAGVDVIVDSTLSPGAARIDLRLGGVSIDTRTGLARLRAALADETADG